MGKKLYRFDGTNGRLFYVCAESMLVAREALANSICEDDSDDDERLEIALGFSDAEGFDSGSIVPYDDVLGCPWYAFPSHVGVCDPNLPLPDHEPQNLVLHLSARGWAEILNSGDILDFSP